ncbi:MAG: hypothetical protein ACRC0G_15905 [Fusobacteriaceae bacterium]
MKLKTEYSDEALKISKKLEYLIYVNNTDTKEICEFVGVNMPNFSRMRSGLRKGEIATLKFLIGISKYYGENFFDFFTH